MTVERKIVVGLGDLKALIFECKNEKCRTRVVISPEKADIPRSCPHCSWEWMPKPPSRNENTVSIYANLVDAIVKIRALEMESGNEWPKFRILLEFDEPELAGRAKEPQQ